MLAPAPSSEFAPAMNAPSEAAGASGELARLGVIAKVAIRKGFAHYAVRLGFGGEESAQGWQLGKQTAAASLGVTVGSAAGGLLFNVAALQGASFVLIAGVTVLGFLLSLRLPQLLVPQNAAHSARVAAKFLT